jgi:hypothetical protein
MSDILSVPEGVSYLYEVKLVCQGNAKKLEIRVDMGADI